MEGGDDALLGMFCTEAEEEKIQKWCVDNKRERSFSFETRLDDGDKLRAEGNEFLNAGDLLTAHHRYLAAIHHLDFDMKQWGEGVLKYQQDLDRCKVKVVINLSRLYLKQKDYGKTKHAADIGLKLLKTCNLDDSDTETKFLYLKGVANLDRGFAEDAVESLKQAIALKPGDGQIRQALAEAVRAQKIDKQKAKDVWRATLLTEEEKRCMGPVWHPSVLFARFRCWCRHRCKKKNKD
eukprot:TRINITY_DN69106_c0_g1_i1.p1 TRINITY_DN69106_c0_g1~~TRINITY_DN69106_c0_g1_i1.p1  ORF type:complete len:237 (+),score=45.84 TRINITY_DN69106_c0_g1_i1:85-795(+)